MGSRKKNKECNPVNTDDFAVKKRCGSDKIVALCGNPNVGKSTVFNELTGLRQHTGNWQGKTVTTAQGYYTYEQTGYIIVDLPGSYSMMTHSAEEEVARDFLCFGGADAVIIVCDATCPERGMNLVLQILEMTPNVVVCFNLMDEAIKKEIEIDFNSISEKLGVPVVGTSARSKKGLGSLMRTVKCLIENPDAQKPISIRYPDYIEAAAAVIEPHIKETRGDTADSRWLALMLLHGEQRLGGMIQENFKDIILSDGGVVSVLDEISADFKIRGITEERVGDDIVSSLVNTAEQICKDTVTYGNKAYKDKDLKIDSVMLGKWTAFPIMVLALLGVFWLTITGANYPSQLLAGTLFRIEGLLLQFFISVHAPKLIYEMLVLGVYRVLAWVVSVMLPPMAIFFPLFTLLEDAGFLPRIAFNLDKCFKKCRACGKQALTMCMGFGCNAVGVTGCRIIDSPRERLIAIITNNFVPCNGRYPTLIAIISMFFAGMTGGGSESLISTLILAGVIALGILLTFLISRFLSETVLKGEASSFTLELPPYRMPQMGKVVIRSVFDRTLLVLGRAVSVAAPAGLLIWCLANITLGDKSLLIICSSFLDPFARMLGMDGVILFAFILGFPANEIVVPIIIMTYMSSGSIIEFESLSQLKSLLLTNGWTWVTATSTMLFCLVHWPCSTTCLTIKKETGSIKWTALSIAIPTVIGMTVCFLFTSAARIAGFA